MELTPLQSSFSAGEISPLMRSRSDLEGYQNGVAEMLNMIPDPRGPALSRSGMKHVLRGDGNNAYLEHLQITESEYFIALFTDLDLSINTTQGQVPGNNLVSNPDFTDGSTGWTERLSTNSTISYAPRDCRLQPYQHRSSTVANPDFSLGGAGWTVRTSHPQSSVTFAGGTCILVPRNQAGNYAGIAQQITTNLPGVQHEVTVVVQAGSDEVEIQIGTAEGTEEYLIQYVTAGTHTFSFTPAASPYWITINCNSDGLGEDATLESVDISEPATGHSAGIAQGVTTTQVGLIHRVSLEMNLSQGEAVRVKLGTAEDDGTYYDALVGSETFETNITPTGATIWITIDAIVPDVTELAVIENVIINEPNPGGDDHVRFDTPYLESELDRLQYVSAPAAGVAYILHPNHPPHKLTYDEATKVWDFVQVTFTSPPSVWAPGKYPVTGYVYQGRLWLGGPDETFWGSKSSDATGTHYEDFTTGATESDAQEFTLNDYGAIRWIVGLKNLLIGTENGEHIITSQGPVIYGGDIQIERQSSYGSAPLQPVQVGDQIFYTSPDRRKIRAMQYEWTANNWLSRDLTFTSEHITAGLIKKMIWAQNPDNLFLAILYSGDIALLRYERGNAIYGWGLLRFQGKIISMTSGSFYGFNEISAITQLVEDKIDLEYIEIAGGYPMDSWIEAFSEAQEQSIGGLEHLEGRVVQVLTDGAVHPDRIVVNGEIDLQWPAEHVVVGLGFDKRLKTLPFDKGAPTGSGAAWTKRAYRPYVRVIDSQKPVVNGVRAPERHAATPMDEVEPGYTEDIEVAQLGYDRYAQITVEQDLPLDLTVAAIFGDYYQSRI